MKVFSANLWPNPAYEWDQFLGVTQGGLQVQVAGSRWNVAANQGLWIPHGQTHLIQAVRPSEILVFFVRDQLLQECSVVAMSPLLRELLRKVTLKGALKTDLPLDVSYFQLVVNEIVASPTVPVKLQWPQSDEMRMVAELLATGSQGPSVSGCACIAGISKRTLERRFFEEVGVGLSKWRREWRLIEAVRMLLDGRSVEEIAFDLGYSGSSAFIETFRKKYGTPPAKFREDLLARTQRL